MYVAKELGMTLGDLRQKMPTEELWLWSLYFEHHQDQERKAMNKGRSLRR